MQILSATIKNRPKRREASNRNAVADEVRKRKEQQMNEKTAKAIQHEELHLALTEDISNLIAKHLPKFDNNIEEQTWNLLALFLDETIQQLS